MNEHALHPSDAASVGQSRDVARLAVLLSGTGRTLDNLLDAIDRGTLRAEVACVVASRECRGAEIARRNRIETRVLEGEMDEGSTLRLLDDVRADWVVLAGYLRRVHIPEAYRGRVVNIHPALLPEFGGPGMYGEHVHRAVLASGTSRSGCTVHLCDDEYDTGPIILQRECPVLPGDTPETLGERVFELECRTYPDALHTLLERAT